MTLRTKAWAAVLAVTVLLVLTLLWIGGQVLATVSDRLEREFVSRGAQRVQNALEYRLGVLERTARDYANWDDTVEFAAGRRPEYPQENFTSETLANLGIPLMLVYNAERRPVGGVHVPATGKAAPRPAEAADFALFARDIAAVVADPEAGTTIRGWKKAGSGVWAYAAVPVTSQQDTGTTRGAFVVARRLDQAYLAELAEVVQRPVSLGADGDAAGLQFEPLADDVSLTFARMDDQRILARVSLLAENHRPAAVLVTELDRPIHRAAVQAGWLLAGIGLGTALLFGVLFSVLLDRFVIRRLQDLHDTVHRVGSEDDPRLRAAVRGDDEIARLGTAINSMLDALARSRSDRELARRRQERLQEQLVQAQKLEAIGEFAGGIAHDFNNCLTSIIGWLNLLREELPPGGKQREQADLALAAADHATAVVGQLRVYSRQGEPSLVRTSLRELLGDSLQLLRSGLPPSIELQLISNCDNDQLFADPTQLRQVVMNLVRNAADAMDGAGRVTVRLDNVALPAADCPGAGQLPAGHYLRLAVEDTGSGVPPELQERIFEPFFTTGNAGRGTGLGLPVVQSVAERHRGAVGLSSPPGAGATFFVYLPIAAATPVTLAPSEPAAQSLAGRRLLLVDDDPRVLQVLARALVKLGCDVVTATDGQDAWEQFLRLDGRTFDFVLTDLTMPRVGGMQLGERIFNSRMAVPVILMTAYAAALDPERIRQAGFYALLPKPLDFGRLAQLLQGIR